MSNRDGGPVYPMPLFVITQDGPDEDLWRRAAERMGENPGLTLRDHFAAAALQGIIAANPTPSGLKDSEVFSIPCACAYLYADALLKARETPHV